MERNQSHYKRYKKYKMKYKAIAGAGDGGDFNADALPEQLNPQQMNALFAERARLQQPVAPQPGPEDINVTIRHLTGEETIIPINTSATIGELRRRYQRSPSSREARPPEYAFRLVHNGRRLPVGDISLNNCNINNDIILHTSRDDLVPGLFRVPFTFNSARTGQDEVIPDVVLSDMINTILSYKIYPQAAEEDSHESRHMLREAMSITHGAGAQDSINSMITMNMFECWGFAAENMDNIRDILGESPDFTIHRSANQQIGWWAQYQHIDQPFAPVRRFGDPAPDADAVQLGQHLRQEHPGPEVFYPPRYVVNGVIQDCPPIPQPNNDQGGFLRMRYLYRRRVQHCWRTGEAQAALGPIGGR